MGLAGGAALGTAAAVRGQASGAPACTLGFAADHYAVIEGGGSIVVQVRRTGSTSGAVTVDYATKDITATAGSDYVEARGSLSFAAGQEAQTITVVVLDDDVVETDETFSISLLAVTSGDAAISSTLGSTTVEIVNDDFPGMLVLPCEDFHIHEGEQKVRISVERVRGCSGSQPREPGRGERQRRSSGFTRPTPSAAHEPERRWAHAYDGIGAAHIAGPEEEPPPHRGPI